MPAAVDPPFATPQPIDTVVNGVPVDWTPNPPPAAPPALGYTVNGDPPTADDPAATPTGATLRLAGRSRITVTAAGNGPTVNDPDPADRWTLSFQGTDVTYDVQDGDTPTLVATALAALAAAIDPVRLLVERTGAQLDFRITSWPFTAPTLANDGAGTSSSAVTGQIVYAPAAVPQNPLATEVNGTPVDWLPPEPVPGGPTV